MKHRSKILRTITRKSRFGKDALLLVLALVLIGHGLSYFLQRQNTLKPVALPKPSVVVTSSTIHPSEVPVNTKTATYNVAPDMPKLISLPSIGAEGFIQQVAIDTATNAVAVPTNVNMAGWYIKSVKPGTDGLSIIDGHVQGYYAPGIFKKLGQLKPQDQFYVEYGDSSKQTFQVVSNTNYAVNDVPQHLFTQDPSIKQQLNLITCGGLYDTANHEYDQRVLVVAKAI